MTKEQMSDQTTERKTSLPNEREVVDFIFSGIDDLSDSMARFSVSPTPDALLLVQEATFEVECDEAIAKALSAIEVTDPNFGRLDLSEEGITDAPAITLAKAKAAEAKVPDEETKDALRNFRDRILGSTGRAVAGIGGKKALTATAGLSLVVAACGPLISPDPQETPVTPQPNSTEVALAQTPESTVTPEPSPTPFPEGEEGVGFIPGHLPEVGGENWQYSEIKTTSSGGEVDTSIIKEEGYIPIAIEGSTVAIRAEGDGLSYFLMPYLEKAGYRKPGGMIGEAEYDEGLSQELVYVYSDEGIAVHRQPGTVPDYQDGTTPISTVDAVGDVWYLYLDKSGEIARKASGFFPAEDSVVVNQETGQVLVNGHPMVISEEEWVRERIDIPTPLFYDQDDNYDYVPRPGMTQEQAMEVVRECWLMTLAKILETRGEGSYEELLARLQNGEIGEMEIDYPAPSQMSALGYTVRTTKLDLAKPIIFAFQTYNSGWLTPGGADYDTSTVGRDSTIRQRFDVTEDGQMIIRVYWKPNIKNDLLIRCLFAEGIRISFIYLAEGGKVVNDLEKTSVDILNLGDKDNKGEVSRKLFYVGNELNELNPIIRGQKANP